MMPVTGLSERLETLGRPIPPLGLRRIEAGTRRVDVDDLVAIAIALGVSPASLLMPEVSSIAHDDLVSVTGWHKPITATVVWGWLTSARPLVRGTLGSFIDHALPQWDRDRWSTKIVGADGDDQ